MSVQTICARRVVDCYETLPLLDCEGFGRIDAQADGFALCVESIEVDMRDDS